MKEIKIFTVIAAFLLAGSGCAEREPAVAHVGRRRITVSDFKQRLEEVPSYYRGFIATEGGKRQYLSGMIKEEILLHKALDENLHRRPDIARRLEEVRREVLLAAAINHLHNEEIKVSDQEIRDYFEKHREEFADPVQLKVSHILLSNENRAREVLQKLRRGASFEKLARENSIDTFTAVNGGDMGFIERGDMPPEFEEPVFSLQSVGEISDVIKTPYGYHIVKLTGRKRGRAESFENARENIKRRLEQQKINELLDRYHRELNVRIDNSVLREVEIEDGRSEESPGD